MKTNRSFFLSFIFIVSFVSLAQAQWSVGLRGGAYVGSVSTPELISAITPDLKWSPGLQVALFAENELSNHVAFRPELVFSQKGFMVREGTDLNLGNFPVALGIKSSYRVSYVEAPLLLKVAAGNELVKLYAIAGPSVGYATHAQLVTRPQAVIEFRPIRTNVSLDALGYNRFEFSAVGGAGLSFKAGAGELMLEARYQQGISRVVSVPLLQTNVRNQGVIMSLGYKVSF
ncbi:porin family protein [Arundinibacter roseus]|nr:porin family protein [Arundinibacter roseus]